MNYFPCGSEDLNVGLRVWFTVYSGNVNVFYEQLRPFAQGQIRSLYIDLLMMGPLREMLLRLHQ